MGMLLRRHQAGVDAVRQVNPTEEDPTLPTVPTGEVPDEPVDPPTGEEAVAEGTPGGAEEVEDHEGTFDDQTATEVKEEVTEAPKRNASKAEWLAFLGVDSDERTRDEIADSVLGPKE